MNSEELVQSRRRLHTLFRYVSIWNATRPPQLAYYTSAHVAISIIEKREFWMRSVRLMNDFSEAQHGMVALNTLFRHGAQWKNFTSAMNARFPGFEQEVMKQADSSAGAQFYRTYITCFSEHTAAEAKYGRLSMWRAYGRGQGVALILNGHTVSRGWFSATTFGKVVYKDDTEAARACGLVLDRVVNGMSRVPHCSLELAVYMTLQLLRNFVLFTKHPAFEEEQEWRLVANGNELGNAALPLHVRQIGEVPQPVVIINLATSANRPTPDNWLDELLIGPSANPEIVRDAFETKLREHGMPIGIDKVRATYILLRTSV